MLKGEQLKKWNDLKDEDDKEDLSEENLKNLERKFTFCHKDIEKKKARKTDGLIDKNLISFETIAKDHPALKFLDTNLLVDIMK